MSGKGALCLVCAVLMASVSAARADDETDATAAEAAFLKGKELEKAGKTEEACESYGRSLKLDPQPGTRYNLALCYEKLGRVASAWGLFRDLAQRDTNAKRKKDADKHAKALAPKLTKMLVNVDFEGVPGLTVMRNGVDVSAQVGIETPVDPGEYVIVAAAEGYKSFSAEVSAQGEGMTVTVAIPPLEKLPAAEEEEIVTPPVVGEKHDDDLAVATPAPSGGGRKRLGLIVGGVGVASALTGGVFGILAIGKWSSAQDICGGDTTCDTDADTAAANDLKSTASLYGNLSTVLVGVGAAAIVTGVVLYLTAPSGGGGGEHALMVTPTGDGVMVSLAGLL